MFLSQFPVNYLHLGKTESESADQKKLSIGGTAEVETILPEFKASKHS